MILGDVPSNGENRILVECDFKISSKCKGLYLKCYKNILASRKINDGKDRCRCCFNTLTKSGEHNYNFKYPKNESFFEKIDSELKAYLLGWVAGDGCIKKDGLYLSVHQKDIEICKLFLQEISPTSAVKYRDYDSTANIIINSVKIVDDLCKVLQVNVGKKSDKIVIPQIDENLIWPFIRGLFDSDGSINRIDSKSTNPRCSIASMSFQIKQELKELCRKNDIKCWVGKTQVTFASHNALKFMRMIYSNANFFLKRKKLLSDEWSTWRPGLGTKSRPRKQREKSTINMNGLPWYRKKYGECR